MSGSRTIMLATLLVPALARAQASPRPLFVGAPASAAGAQHYWGPNGDYDQSAPLEDFYGGTEQSHDHIALLE